MVGTNGSKFPAIRTHLDEKIGQVYADMDISQVAMMHHRVTLNEFLQIQELSRRRQD